MNGGSGLAQVFTIRLTSEDHRALDSVCGTIRAIAEQTGIRMRGPIPLPTRRLVVPCRKSPDGEGCETFDHWEMRIHKRMIELVSSGNKEDNAVRQLTRLKIPDSVTIEFNMRIVT